MFDEISKMRLDFQSEASTYLDSFVYQTTVQKAIFEEKLNLANVQKNLLEL